MPLDPELDLLETTRRQLAEERQRTAIFEACLHRALKLFQNAHPECNFWPDGADNFAWLFEQVKQLDELMECLHPKRYQVNVNGHDVCTICEMGANDEIKAKFKEIATCLLRAHERDEDESTWTVSDIPCYEVTDEEERDRGIAALDLIYGEDKGND